MASEDRVRELIAQAIEVEAKPGGSVYNLVVSKIA